MLHVLISTLNITLFIEDWKYFPRLSPFASWPGTKINHHWFELPMSRRSFHGPRDIQAIEVRLYLLAHISLPLGMSCSEHLSIICLSVNLFKWYGPSHVKKCLWTCAKCVNISFCTWAKYHPGLCSRSIHFVVSNDSCNGQLRPWSDSADVQADLDRRCLHIPEDTFSHGKAQTVASGKRVWTPLEAEFSSWLYSASLHRAFIISVLI